MAKEKPTWGEPGAKKAKEAKAKAKAAPPGLQVRNLARGMAYEVGYRLVIDAFPSSCSTSLLPEPACSLRWKSPLYRRPMVRRRTCRARSKPVKALDWTLRATEQSQTLGVSPHGRKEILKKLKKLRGFRKFRACSPDLYLGTCAAFADNAGGHEPAHGSSLQSQGRRVRLERRN